MYSTLTRLIDRLSSPNVTGTNVIHWSCPVPSFGDLSTSRVATLGLNPSNREFVDEAGNELLGTSRRFHTLQSLGLNSWCEADSRHISMILDTCRTYFCTNPYDRWFKILDHVIAGTGASYYGSRYGACHLDLIPYATASKWTDLTGHQRSSLLKVSSDTLALLLRDSPVRVLVLNGQSVVNQFLDITNVSLTKQEMPEWSLPRKSTPNVPGVAYLGTVDALSDITLNQNILVLGFNHNLQSSFGVTRNVINAIRDWVAHKSTEAIL